jgi:hypothetical protein
MNLPQPQRRLGNNGDSTMLTEFEYVKFLSDNKIVGMGRQEGEENMQDSFFRSYIGMVEKSGPVVDEK